MPQVFALLLSFSAITLKVNCCLIPKDSGPSNFTDTTIKEFHQQTERNIRPNDPVRNSINIELSAFAIFMMAPLPN